MKSSLVTEASKVIPESHRLINLVSRRVRQLNSGSRPMVPLESRMGLADIALMEIAQGQLNIRKEEAPQAPS